MRSLHDTFDAASDRAGRAAGSAWTFGIAALVVIVWAVTGPLFGFSDTWQLAINTGTTIVTFLMVFLLQHTQNKDTGALHVKLDALIAATKGASNRLLDVERKTDREIEAQRGRFEALPKTGSGRIDMDDEDERPMRAAK